MPKIPVCLWITRPAGGKIRVALASLALRLPQNKEPEARAHCRFKTDNRMEEFWQTCASRLQQELTPQQFSAWIKPLAPLDFEDGRLRIAAPNRFKLDWVKTQFAARIT